MPQRLAAVISLVAFATCLAIGSFQADNGFMTVVSRALLAMGVTFVIGLILGWMAQKMLEENLKVEKKKLEESEVKSSATDR